MKLRVVILLTLILGICLNAYGEDLPKKIMGKDGAPMMLIPEGQFVMGSAEEDLVAIAPPHKVHVDVFYMDAHEVSNALFVKFLNDVRPYEGIGDIRWQWVVIRSDLEFTERAMMWPTEIVYEYGEYVALGGYENHPVISVSWDAADAYCEWAGKRLPAEAEWEIAARGGLKGKAYPWGDAVPTIGPVLDKRWRYNTSPPPTGPVNNYLPNRYGLYNIAGNVWEWCSDWYSPNYYKKSPRKNPQGPEMGMEKVLRGGGWHNNAYVLRVAFRNWAFPSHQDEGVGIRCAKTAQEASKSSGP